jgi:hypothetical protein
VVSPSAPSDALPCGCIPYEHVTKEPVMGREIKRVPLDFDWPLDKTWGGFLRSETFPDCPDCRYDGSFSSGYSPEANAIAETFYPHMIGYGDHAKRLAWADKLGQAEVDNLLAKGRLRTWVMEDGKGRWEKRPLTAAEVNARQRQGGLDGHDAINRGILVEFRCKRLGITVKCPTCDGHGDLATPEQRQAADEWTGTEPPEGEGWQVWETVSEGSPITPVFPTADALIDHLATVGTTWDQRRGEGP